MKYAIAIGLNYRGTQNELGGCENDARDYEVRMTRVSGFVYFELSVYNLVGLLQDAARQMKPADTLYLTFSGHGTTFSDGTQAIVLYSKSKGFEAIADHDLRYLLQQIPAAVVVILDSCFSGGMDRAAVSPIGKPKYISPDGIPLVQVEKESARQSAKPYRITYMEACGPDEYSWDLGTNGLFTKRFCEAFDSGLRTVGKLMRKVAVTAQPDQHPQVVYAGGSSLKKLF